MRERIRTIAEYVGMGLAIVAISALAWAAFFGILIIAESYGIKL